MNHQTLATTATLSADARSDRHVRLRAQRRSIRRQDRLDVFGVGVMAFVAGNAGGMARDVLIGAVPPAAISDWRYVVVSLIAGVATFLWYPSVARVQRTVLLFDAAGLAMFAVAGTQKALAYCAIRSRPRCSGC